MMRPLLLLLLAWPLLLAADLAPVVTWRQATINQDISGRATASVVLVAGMTQPVFRLLVPIKTGSDQLSAAIPVRGRIEPGLWQLSLRVRLSAGAGSVGIGLVRDGRLLAEKNLTPGKTWETCVLEAEIPAEGGDLALKLAPAPTSVFTLDVTDAQWKRIAGILGGTTSDQNTSPGVAAQPAVPLIIPGSGNLLTPLDGAKPWLEACPGGSRHLVPVVSQPFVRALRFTFPTATPHAYDAGVYCATIQPLAAGARYLLVVPVRSPDPGSSVWVNLRVRDPAGKEPAKMSQEFPVGPAWSAFQRLVMVKRDLASSVCAVEVQTGGRPGTIEVGEPVLRPFQGTGASSYEAVIAE